MSRPARQDLVTRAQLAAALGVNPSTIAKWVAAGCPVAQRDRLGHARLFVRADVEAWRDTNAEDAHAVRGDLRLDQERAKKERALAELAELKIAVQRGALVAVDTVLQEGRLAFGNARDRFRVLPRLLVQRGLLARAHEAAALAAVDEILAELKAWRRLELSP